MPGSEWSLIVFTLLAQAGVGILLAGEIIKPIISKKVSSKKLYLLTSRSRLFALIFTSAALAVSFLHLGSPLKAFNALNNLRSSWLSREILAAVVFLFFLTTSVLITRLKKSSGSVNKLIVGMTACSGFFLILAMSFLYMLSGVKTWDNIITPLSFFTSAFLLGFMASSVLSLQSETTESVSKANNKGRNSTGYMPAFRTTVSISFYLAFFQIVLAVILSLRLHNLSSLYSPFESTILKDYGGFISFRIILILVGMGLILLSPTEMKLKKVSSKVPVWLIYPAFSLILLSEILGRYLFYTLFFRAGL